MTSFDTPFVVTWHCDDVVTSRRIHWGTWWWMRQRYLRPRNPRTWVNSSNRNPHTEVSPAPEKFQFATPADIQFNQPVHGTEQIFQFFVGSQIEGFQMVLAAYQVYQLPVPAQVKGRQPVGPAGQAFQLPVGYSAYSRSTRSKLMRLLTKLQMK